MEWVRDNMGTCGPIMLFVGTMQTLILYMHACNNLLQFSTLV